LSSTKSVIERPASWAAWAMVRLISAVTRASMRSSFGARAFGFSAVAGMGRLSGNLPDKSSSTVIGLVLLPKSISLDHDGMAVKKVRNTFSMPKRPNKPDGKPSKKLIASDQPELPLDAAPTPALDEPPAATPEANGNGATDAPAEVQAEAVAPRRKEGEKVQDEQAPLA